MLQVSRGEALDNVRLKCLAWRTEAQMSVRFRNKEIAFALALAAAAIGISALWLSAAPPTLAQPVQPGGPMAGSPGPAMTTTATPTATCNTIFLALSGRFALIAWPGADGSPVGVALGGGADHCGTDITADVTVVWGFDATTQTFAGYFPAGVGIPGANDLTAFTHGLAYWIGLVSPSPAISWGVENTNPPGSMH